MQSIGGEGRTGACIDVRAGTKARREDGKTLSAACHQTHVNTCAPPSGAVDPQLTRNLLRSGTLGAAAPAPAPAKGVEPDGPGPAAPAASALAAPAAATAGAGAGGARGSGSSSSSSRSPSASQRSSRQRSSCSTSSRPVKRWGGRGAPT